MEVFIRLQVERTEGPFRSRIAVAEAIIEELSDTIEVDGSQYALTDAEIVE